MTTRRTTTRAIGNQGAMGARWPVLCAFALNTGGIGFIPIALVIAMLFDLLGAHGHRILVVATVALACGLIYPLLPKRSGPMYALGDGFARERGYSLFPISAPQRKAKP